MSAGDDDKTPPRGTRPTKRERQEHAKRYPPIVPVIAGLDEEPSGVVVRRHEEFTSPIDMYERPLQPDEIEVARRLRRDSDSPKVLVDRLTDAVSRLTIKLDEQRKTERSNNENRANQLVELLGRVPGDAAESLRSEFDDKIDNLSITLDDGKKLNLFDAVKGLLRDASIGKWVMRTVAGAAITVLLYVANTISARAEQQGAMGVRILHLEEENAALRASQSADMASFRQEISALRAEINQDHRDERSRRQPSRGDQP